MTIWYSSDLGWTAGQDVSAAFASLVANQFKPGDTFVLDEMYRISGSNLKLPDDFTLAAEYGGGFDIFNTKTDNSPLLLLGDRNTLDNVTITASGAPDTDYSGVHAVLGTDFHAKKAIGVFGAHDVTIVNSAFSGNISMFLDVRGSDNLTVENTSFEGGFYQVRLLGDTEDARFVSSSFEDSLGDGIKTERGGEYGPQRIQILDSFFADNNRDGIDTAGGFKDSLVSNTVFYNNGVSAIDIKTLLERPSDLSPEIANTGIRIENSQIIDSRNGIVVTMLDRMGALTAANADQLMPHDIVITNTTFEKTAAHSQEMRAFHIKDGHSITWNDITFLGDINELRLQNAEAPSGWSAYDVGGTITTRAASDGIEGLWPHNPGPVAEGPFADTSSSAPEIDSGNESPSPDTALDSDDTDGLPTPDPDPVDENEDVGSTEPPPDVDTLWRQIDSKFLNIFATFTDTQESLLLSGGPGTIDLSALEGRDFTLVATAKDTSVIGSVKLEFGEDISQLENIAPYALFGDRQGNLNDGTMIDAGVHRVGLTVYSLKNGKGEILEQLSFDLEFSDGLVEDEVLSSTEDADVVEANQIVQEGATSSGDGPSTELASSTEADGQPTAPTIPVPDDGEDTVVDWNALIEHEAEQTEKAASGPAETLPQPIKSGLLDIYATFTDTGEATLLSGTFGDIDLSEFIGRQMTLVAVTRDPSTSIGSVKLDMDGVASRIENVEPYALFGDTGGKLFDGASIKSGAYSVNLTAFSGKSGAGDILETTSFTLSISDKSSNDNYIEIPTREMSSDELSYLETERAENTWDEFIF